MARRPMDSPRRRTRTPRPRELRASPPQERVMVLCCVDRRVDPATPVGARADRAFYFRNAGGRVTDDFLRTLLITQPIGCREVMVIHHTECGLNSFTNATLHQRIPLGTMVVALTPQFPSQYPINRCKSPSNRWRGDPCSHLLDGSAWRCTKSVAVVRTSEPSRDFRGKRFHS